MQNWDLTAQQQRDTMMGQGWCQPSGALLSGSPWHWGKKSSERMASFFGLWGGHLRQLFHGSLFARHSRKASQRRCLWLRIDNPKKVNRELSIT